MAKGSNQSVGSCSEAGLKCTCNFMPRKCSNNDQSQHNSRKMKCFFMAYRACRLGTPSPWKHSQVCANKSSPQICTRCTQKVLDPSRALHNSRAHCQLRCQLHRSTALLHRAVACSSPHCILRLLPLSSPCTRAVCHNSPVLRACHCSPVQAKPLLQSGPMKLRPLHWYLHLCHSNWRMKKCAVLSLLCPQPSHTSSYLPRVMNTGRCRWL